MQKLGGAVTLMQQSSISDEYLKALEAVSFLTGNKEQLIDALSEKVLKPFDDCILDFLNDLSKHLIQSKKAKKYPDIVTFGFWIRNTSIMKLKERFYPNDHNIHMGRGIAFHISPSNVPVNYAYSLIAGLITGNINIVRIPSKDFPQVEIINKAINEVLENHIELKNYIFLVKYDRNKQINDFFSSIANTRIVWGGDNTIAELRKSPIGPRAGEITFADRYSISVINSEQYLSLENKKRLAEDFYNDTYLTDQNACTSPRIVVWIGAKKEEAKEEFWENLHDVVANKYEFQSIMGINKLTTAYLFASQHEGVEIAERTDNYIIRVQIKDANCDIMNNKENSGFFYEYDCNDLMEIRDLCNDTHCQTVGYLGDKEMFIPLLTSGIRGIDRIVPIGKTMDFDLLWDGYNLFERLTRTVVLG